MRIKMLCCASLLLAGLALGKTMHAANVADFVDFTLSVGGNPVLPGRLYVPPIALSDPSTPRPLITFLHGAGENGTNNLAQINQNIDGLLNEAKARNAFLYAPQTASSWSPTSVTSNVNAMIAQALSDYSVDADRLYVTGLSLGGGGAWDILNRYPDTFAAGVPICGVNPSGDFSAVKLVDQAIWVSHARDDPVVGVSSSRVRVNQILGAAGLGALTFPALNNATDGFEFHGDSPDLHYVEPPTGGHVIWFETYTDPAMYDWLFAHTLAVPEPSGAATMTLAGLLSWPFMWRRRAKK